MKELTRDISLDIVRPVLTEIAEYDMRTIAPQLEADPTALQRHILECIGATASPQVISLINENRYDCDDDSGAEADYAAAATLLKFERWTIIQSATIPQAYHLLGGLAVRPQEARFRHTIPPSEQNSAAFFEDHVRTFCAAREEISDELPWLRNVAGRYKALGEDALYTLQPLFGSGFVYSDVSMNLADGLNGSALALATVEISELLKTHAATKRMSADERHHIAHDLASLGLAQASTHFLNMHNGVRISELEGDIAQLPNGTWIYRRKSKARREAELREKLQSGTISEEDFEEQWHDMQMYSDYIIDDSEKHPSPTMKCPVHQPLKTQPHSYLEYELHASITHAHETYNLFSRK